jgi:UDP-N-acetylmuramoyl-tripeptide--D-alanyl-D-alanine ligase
VSFDEREIVARLVKDARVKWTEAAVREALEMRGAGEGRTFTTISTDTRSIVPGALFVALSGERFDAHQFLPAAAASGATAAIVRQGTPSVPGLDLLEVADPLRAFGSLARARRRRLTGPVVAITGTNGKTSTKEMLAAVLGTRYVTYATRANLNNLVGVPLTILEAPEDTEAMVVEAGANLPGEIARYRDIVEPRITIVTNAVRRPPRGVRLAGRRAGGKALPDRRGGARGRRDRAGRAAAGARARARRVRTAGLQGAELTPDRVEMGPEARPVLTLGGETFTLAARGLHQADNAVRVWAVVEELGLERAAAARALEGFRLPGGRGELLEANGLTILNDCYNANPQSFRSVIATARALRGNRRLVMVAGTMRELGGDSERLHAEVARELVNLEPNLLAAVGDFVPALAPYAERFGDRLLTATDPPALAPLLAARVRPGDVVVLKASRGVALERVLPALLPQI